MAHDFIARAFYGPRQRSVQRRRAEFDYPLLLGWSTRFVAVIADLLRAWGLEGAPCVMAEDGTALQVSIWLLMLRTPCPLAGQVSEQSNFQIFDDLKKPQLLRLLQLCMP